MIVKKCGCDILSITITSTKLTQIKNEKFNIHLII